MRQNAPVVGAYASPYLQPGEWQASLAVRSLTSDQHYRLDHHEVQREVENTYVINKQRLFDAGITYQATSRLNVAVSIPFVNSSWALPAPFRPPGPRVPQKGQGLGDILAVGRYWLLDTTRYLRGNVAVGVGVKLPTGDDDVRAFYPDISGANWAEKAIDQSVQPGDGGWGLLVDAQAFRRIRRGVVFASGTYLANPRNTNDTPSLVVGLGRGGDPANYDKLVNSVADQYLVRAGGAIAVWKGLGASVAFRMEGLRRYDLFGGSNGFRRPGYELFVEPGVSYSHGTHSVTFNLPIGTYRMRLPDPNTGIRGDATFPEYVALASYAFRFGGSQRKTLPPTPVPGVAR